MAEINVASKTGRRRPSAPRVDLTPMVDLGFLLITFFMFTTAMAKPKTMELNMPDNSPTQHPTAFAAESTITILAAEKHTFYYYSGAPDDTHVLLHGNINWLRDAIIKKKQDAATLPASYSADAHKLHVILKPTQNCTYDDVIGLLDEMQINAIECYAVADVTAYEMGWVARSNELFK